MIIVRKRPDISSFCRGKSSGKLFIRLKSKFRNDHDSRIFLTYDGDLAVRGKNAKEKLTGWFTKGQQAFDTIMTDKQPDPDEYYEEKKIWLNEYHTR